MILTAEQQAILDGAKGETMAKVMKTMVMHGAVPAHGLGRPGNRLGSHHKNGTAHAYRQRADR